MRSHFRIVIWSVVSIGALMVILLGFRLGVEGPLSIGNFSPLVGAFIGGIMALVCANLPRRQEADTEPWVGYERLGWSLIGIGCIAWGIGESVWRYYEARGQTPFPSLADVGYASFPPLIFIGLLLLPSAKSGQRRTFFLLDSLIATGALLSIAWFLLLGPLAQTPAESTFARALGLYYPTMDTALVSCTVFLLLREANTDSGMSARRISLLVAGLGLFVFAGADFLFNVQENVGTYVEGTWIDLGWPLGIMALGVAAYVRCFLHTSSGEVLERLFQPRQRVRQLQFGPTQAIPYLLLIVLLCLLAFNVLSTDNTQQSIRPVLVAATMIVVCLVLARQILTLLDNAQLAHKQMETLQELGRINQSIAEHNAFLEDGVTHLKDVQTRLANGDVRARAQLTSGELWPLAIGLNLMADRMMRSERSQSNAQLVARAVDDFSQALEQTRTRAQLSIPASCLRVPEMHRLLLAMGIKPSPEPTQSIVQAPPSQLRNPSLNPGPDHSSTPYYHRPSDPPRRR